MKPRRNWYTACEVAACSLAPVIGFLAALFLAHP